MFAGILLGLAGFLDIIWGIAAIANSKFFTADTTYIVSGLHSWGWVTLLVGLVQLFAAISLFSGGGFGRLIGIIAAALAAFDALALTGSTPFWGLSVFALAIIVIYQLAKAPETAAAA